MPGAARLSDTCTGHASCYPSRPNIQASDNVFINDRGAHRQTDGWANHCKKCGLSRPCHTGKLASGSPTVFTNDLQAGRIGDPVDCGSKVMTGSADVIIGP